MSGRTVYLGQRAKQRFGVGQQPDGVPVPDGASVPDNPGTVAPPPGRGP
ncbi:hypothetical protein JOF56_009551 [Kibdelosporangium banguiense]|uniref:Uncharacterized protein n=1 Tax=Kibdelosporangium banguiense TaxID=1365924 RepID=A0ABS4TXR6_9PSEU|nr:hypothetical protein [Kibdelosporangium banguiense]